MKKLLKFFYAFTAVMLTGFICSKLTDIGINGWYNRFDKPFLTPPNAVFPIAWSIIYVLMILSVFIVLRDATKPLISKANNLFLVQLFLQIFWCFTFFAEGYLGFGFAVLLLLDISVYKMIKTFAKINRFASILLYPYFCWLLFATFLNLSYAYNYGLIIVF